MIEIDNEAAASRQLLVRNTYSDTRPGRETNLSFEGTINAPTNEI